MALNAKTRQFLDVCIGKDATKNLCDSVDTASAFASPAGTVASLTGTLTGTVDGAIADVAAVAISSAGGNTYADATVNTAVNVAVTSINLQLKELQTTLNAVISALKAAGLMSS